SFPVLVHSVPTKLNLSLAPSMICSENPQLALTPSLIPRAEWANSQTGKHGTKARSSLVLQVTDWETSDRLVRHGINIFGVPHNTTKFKPFPTQCYFCQCFGHKVAVCSDKVDPANARCARCAGPHLTKSC
ncbi:hypothetical protein DL93DRAFT_2046634, partial [Clavulina sp. PMI_390]